MTPADDTLPGPWAAEAVGDESRLEKLRFELDADGATLSVSILDRDGPDGPCEIRLTTMTDGRSPDRHDYPVETCATSDAAIERAEALVDLLDARIRDGDVSGTDPSVAEIQAVVEEFTGPGWRSRFRRSIGRLAGKLRDGIDAATGRL